MKTDILVSFQQKLSQQSGVTLIVLNKQNIYRHRFTPELPD
jgi:hypothetical protein